ncbi:MAG: nucleoside diphosphate kinase regulator [Sneathiellaceae bacterium]
MAHDTISPEPGGEPPVVLDALHVDRLEALADGARRRQPVVAQRLMHEIMRATVLPSGEMPADVVNLGSEVAFRDESTDALHTVVLVMPEEADIGRRQVSVLTPIGAALIGLAAGASFTWATPGGVARRLTVTSVSPGGTGGAERGLCPGDPPRQGLDAFDPAGSPN